MSVKLLHPNARSLLEARVKWLTDAIAKYELLAMGRFPPALQTSLEKYRSAKKVSISLLDDLAWRSISKPFALRFASYEDTAGIFGRKILGTIFVFKNAFYAVNGPYEEEEARLILLDALNKQKRKAEYLVARKDVPESELAYERQPITEEVRHEVWRRDKGRCITCGSVNKLEYDHIIPVSRGGANTARNIQLLCESCNRRKSNNIG